MDGGRAGVHLAAISRWAGAVAALAFAASGAPSEKPVQEPKAASLAGQLLVASPELRDPRFFHAVVYVVRHDASGALGLVVNRPYKDVPIATLLERLGQEHDGVQGSLRMRYGGPVEPGRVFVLHTADYRGEGTRVIGDGIALTVNPGILRAIGKGAGPRRALLTLSYSGWGPGQLEMEIRAGAWTLVPADPALVFDDQDDTKWQRAMGGKDKARKSVDL